MSTGIGFRQRAIENAAALTPGYLTEYSRLIDNGMVFAWDASGPLAGMDQFANALPEFTYLALDDQPVRSYIKRTRPGVRPVVWDKGPAMPDFTLQQFLDSEAAAAVSAAGSAASAKASAGSATAAAASAGVAANIVSTAKQEVFAAADRALTGAQQARLDAQYAQYAARSSARDAALYAAEAIALIGAQIPAPIPIALTSLLTATMALLPTDPPAGEGQPWMNNGVLVFTPSSDAAKAAAVAAAGKLNQTQLNPVMLATMLQGMAAGLPTEPPAGAGQPWLNNGVLVLSN